MAHGSAFGMPTTRTKGTSVPFFHVAAPRPQGGMRVEARLA